MAKTRKKGNTRNTLNLDLSGLEELLTKFEGLGGDVEAVAAEALETAAKKIEVDTEKALDKSNLPEKGKYSKGKTIKSIVRSPKADISGNLISINVGFDYSKPGAGGFLITGTPKMKPDAALNRMYKGKKYMKEVQETMAETVNAHILKQLEDK